MAIIRTVETTWPRDWQRPAALWMTRRFLPEWEGPVEPEGYCDETAFARVNHGRWIVDCPYCRSAQIACRSDLRFFCVECRNAGSDRWCKVEWPPDRDRIEELLGARRDPRTRNWRVNESVEALTAENIEHGVRSR